MEKEIVLYRTFDSPVEANIVKDVLETNGVPRLNRNIFYINLIHSYYMLLYRTFDTI